MVSLNVDSSELFWQQSINTTVEDARPCKIFQNTTKNHVKLKQILKMVLPISMANLLAFFKFRNTSVSGSSILFEKVFVPIVEGIAKM